MRDSDSRRCRGSKNERGEPTGDAKDHARDEPGVVLKSFGAKSVRHRCPSTNPTNSDISNPCLPLASGPPLGKETITASQRTPSVVSNRQPSSTSDTPTKRNIEPARYPPSVTRNARYTSRHQASAVHMTPGAPPHSMKRDGTQGRRSAGRQRNQVSSRGTHEQRAAAGVDWLVRGSSAVE